MCVCMCVRLLLLQLLLLLLVSRYFLVLTDTFPSDFSCPSSQCVRVGRRLKGGGEGRGVLWGVGG